VTVLRARAPGKVNLALFLGALRPRDGRHELVSLVEPVTLADWLELGPAPGGAAADEVFCEAVSGPNLAGDALTAFRAATGWDGPPVRLTIFKRVPIAAGMGGGSADAAAALRLAARVSGRGEKSVLEELAAGLGADVPAALHAAPAVMTGAGEVVDPIDPLPPHAFVIVPSGHYRLSTAAVYAEAERLGLPRSSHDLAGRRAAVGRALADGEIPADLVHNDLERAARSLCPPIDGVLADVRAAGATHALVSGSGPTVAGVVLGDEAEQAAGRIAEDLRDRHPGAVAAFPAPPGYARVREFAEERP
jgi:4-diphosphocytidyl-2-C-methyl-D-erythritol kinase